MLEGVLRDLLRRRLLELEDGGWKRLLYVGRRWAMPMRKRSRRRIRRQPIDIQRSALQASVRAEWGDRRGAFVVVVVVEHGPLFVTFPVENGVQTRTNILTHVSRHLHHLTQSRLASTIPILIPRHCLY